MRNLRIKVGLAIASFVVGASVYGQQDTPQRDQSKEGPPMGQKSEADSQEHAIKVRVNEVLVPVTVLNSKGDMILDLSRDNFQIFDGDVEQTIEHFDLGGE